MALEVITRYEKAMPTVYSFDGGKSWLTKKEFKQLIHKAKKEME